MKYNIKWCEKKTTSTNKEKMDATLVDTNGNETANVSIWSDFPGYAELMNGSDVEGDLVPAKDPKYGPTLYQARSNLGPKPAGLGGVRQAQERKAAGIEKAQDKKEESIAISSSFRDATLICTMMYANVTMTEEQFKDKWKNWRTWLLANFTNQEVRNQVDANNIPF